MRYALTIEADDRDVSSATISYMDHGAVSSRQVSVQDALRVLANRVYAEPLFLPDNTRIVQNVGASRVILGMEFPGRRESLAWSWPEKILVRPGDELYNVEYAIRNEFVSCCVFGQNSMPCEINCRYLQENCARSRGCLSCEYPAYVADCRNCLDLELLPYYHNRRVTRSVTLPIPRALLVVDARRKEDGLFVPFQIYLFALDSPFRPDSSLYYYPMGNIYRSDYTVCFGGNEILPRPLSGMHTIYELYLATPSNNDLGVIIDLESAPDLSEDGEHTDVRRYLDYLSPLSEYPTHLLYPCGHTLPGFLQRIRRDTD